MAFENSSHEALRIVIVGASSGMGRLLAQRFIAMNCRVGVAARREEALLELKALAPERVEVQALDVTEESAEEKLKALIACMGGMDVFLYCSGVFRVNMSLEAAPELETVRTNAIGFTRMVGTAYRYLAQEGGHLAAITSIAGTGGLGAVPAYSATKSFQNIYLDALEQNARMNGWQVSFTDIRPGFVDTPLLGGHRFPHTMCPEKVVNRIVEAVLHRRRVVTIDGFYALLVFFWRLVPRWLWKRLPLRA